MFFAAIVGLGKDSASAIKFCVVLKEKEIPYFFAVSVTPFLILFCLYI